MGGGGGLELETPDEIQRSNRSATLLSPASALLGALEETHMA